MHCIYAASEHILFRYLYMIFYNDNRAYFMQNAIAETQKRLNLHIKILCDAIVFYIQQQQQQTLR